MQLSVCVGSELSTRGGGDREEEEERRRRGGAASKLSCRVATGAGREERLHTLTERESQSVHVVHLLKSLVGLIQTA